MKAVTAAEMRRLDRAAIDDVGIPGLVLMENAGRGAFYLLHEALQERGLRRVAVLCGPGNNGGDGYVIARHLANHGYHVVVLATRTGPELKGDARTNWQAARAMGIPMIDVVTGSDLAAIDAQHGPFEAVCDALLGTGVDKPLAGIYRELVEWANLGSTYRFAVDLPTGLHADSGAVLGCAFQAHQTATFGLPKLGLLLYPGTSFAGQVRLVYISLPDAVLKSAQGVELLDDEAHLPKCPVRVGDTYKNRMGHLLLVAGSPGKAGAALISGLAALRTGVGLCTAATHQASRAIVAGKLPDLMVEGLDFDDHPERQLREFARGKSAVAVGPGMGTCDEACDLVRTVLEELDMPVLLDADALTVLANQRERVGRPRGEAIMTPHPGELARLVGLTAAEIQRDRIGVARKTAVETGIIVVLKGARTVVAHPDGRVALNLSGTPAMAKAGSGDVLTGHIGALLAMGMNAWDAARLGVFLHGRAGELMEEQKGIHGVLASDLAEALPEVMVPCV